MKDPRPPRDPHGNRTIRKYRMVALLLALISLTGCASYYEAQRDIAKSRDEHPRMATVTFTPQNQGQPMVVSNAAIKLEIPMDSWLPIVQVDSGGKQVGDVLRAATPLALGLGMFDFLKAAFARPTAQTTTTSTTTSGQGAGVNTAGGNVGTSTINAPSTTTSDNHSGTTGQ